MRDPDPPLFQESMRDDPFWMIVGCLLVNRATWAKAGPIHAQLRRNWPTPVDLASADAYELAGMLVPLGFGTTRWRRVRDFAMTWKYLGPPRYAEDLLERPGCGMYAVHTWAIFVEGRRDVRPTDRRLRQYLARAEPVS